MIKGRKDSRVQMNLITREGECKYSEDLFATEIPVWYEGNGEVRSEWLSICEGERNQTKRLLESVIDLGNLRKAYAKVRSNGGSSGVDKESIEDFGIRFRNEYGTIQSSILEGRYEPKEVKGVQIPKPQGGYRQLGIPTVEDRVVQQAILQVLQPYYDPKFSEFSYGFRPHRSAHQALVQSCRYVKGGYTRVVDIDLSKFFDEVNHQRLEWLLSTRIGDNRLLGLIGKILRTGILESGLVSQRTKGTPQGSPLSPLLSNIVLDELDQELQRRGLRYVRYADDVKVFVRSKLSSERVMSSLSRFIEERMLLKINQEKSGIRYARDTEFLGYRLQYGGKLIISAKSELRLKDKLRVITSRKRGVSFEQLMMEVRLVLSGWLHYFKMAQMKKKLMQIEGWLRRRLKCYRLKQCKRAIGIVRFMRSLGVEETLSWRLALSGKGWWRKSNTPATNIGMNNEWFASQGYYSLSEHYEKLHRKPL
jgi:RNA-directed DNA polymerase